MRLLSKKIRLALALIGMPIVAFAAWIVIKGMWDTHANGASWILVFYTSTDKGRSHEEAGRGFRTLQECKDFAEAKNKTGVLIRCAEKEGNCVADEYLCGRGCNVEALVGSVFIEEYRCLEHYDGALRSS